MDYFKNLVVGQKMAHFKNDQSKVLDIFFLFSFNWCSKLRLGVLETNSDKYFWVWKLFRQRSIMGQKIA